MSRIAKLLVADVILRSRENNRHVKEMLGMFTVLKERRIEEHSAVELTVEAPYLDEVEPFHPIPEIEAHLGLCQKANKGVVRIKYYLDPRILEEVEFRLQ